MRKLVDDGCNATICHETVPETVLNGQLVTPRKREHAHFAERPEKSTRLARSRVAAKTVFLRRVAVDDHPRPDHHFATTPAPTPSQPGWQTFKFLFFFKNQLAKNSCGPNVQNAQSMQSFHAIVNGSSWYWAPGGILCYEAYREESGTTRSNRNLRAKSH